MWQTLRHVDFENVLKRCLIIEYVMWILQKGVVFGIKFTNHTVFCNITQEIYRCYENLFVYLFDIPKKKTFSLSNLSKYV